MGPVRRVGYISSLAVVGEPPQDRVFDGVEYPPVVEDTATLEALCQVDAGTVRCTYVGHDSWVMKQVHVGHDAWIGPSCELCPGVVVCGHVVMLGWNRVGVGAVFNPFVVLGKGARIGSGAVVLGHVPPGEVWAGNPARRLSSSPVWEGGDEWLETALTPSAASSRML